MAEGGKSEGGILKEKRACNPDDRPASVLGVATCEEERAEKKGEEDREEDKTENN